MTVPQGHRAITWHELRRKVPWSRAYILQQEKLGKFPKRIRLGPNSVAWFEHEIDAWLEARAAEREVA
jgi:prophage regulatory protein